MGDPKIVIVGGGISGLMAALKVMEKGIPVDIFSLTRCTRSSSVTDQSGINAALNTKGEDDSVEQHIEDTVSTGGFLSPRRPIEKMCRAAPGTVYMYERLGVTFNRTPEGLIDLKASGKTKRRTLVAGESTGQQCLYALDRQIRRFEAAGLARRFEFWHFNSVVRSSEGRCVGITATNMRTMEIKVFRADAVIMCTGGYGRIFDRSAASIQSTGSAASAVCQQGVVFANGEFVQFYPPPTTDGGREEVSPGARYTLGGIYVGEDHMTSIPGLFAAGECAYLYRGADTLEGNSLLSATFGGFEAGLSAAEFLLGSGWEMERKEPTSYEDELKRQRALDKTLASQDGEENIYRIKQELSEVMIGCVGPVRKNNKLKEADQRLQELAERFNRCGTVDRSKWANREIFFKRNVLNMLYLARAITQGALNRDESRGVHCKPEFPHRDDKNWRKITKAEFTIDGPCLGYEDVD